MRTFFVIILVLCFLNIQGQIKLQNFSFSANVIDSMAKAPLEFVNVSLLNTRDSIFIKGTITDKVGKFNFQNITIRQFILRVTAIGYVPKFMFIDLEKNAFLPDTVFLIPMINELDEIKIAAAKKIYTVKSNKHIYNIENDVFVQNSSLLDALQNAPAVSVDIDNTITLRGSQNIRFYVDDRELTLNNEQIIAYLQQLPANLVQSIEVITNPSAKYNSGSAVINIVMKKKQSDTKLYCIGSNFSSYRKAYFWNSYRYKKNAWDVFISVSAGLFPNQLKSKYLTSYLNRQDTFMQVFSVRNEKLKNYYTYSKSDIRYNVSKNIMIRWNTGILASSDFNDKQITKNVYAIDTLNYRTTNKIEETSYTIYSNLEYEQNFDEKGHQLNLSFGGNYYFYELTDKQQKITSFEYSSKLRNSDLEWIGYSYRISGGYSRPITDWLTIESGINCSLFSLYNESKKVDTASTDKNFQPCVFQEHNYLKLDNELSAYADFSGTMGNFDYNLGVRYEMMKSNYKKASQKLKKKTYNDFFPSFSLSYNLNENNNFAMSYSLEIYNPLEELMPFRDYSDDDYVKTGNQNLKSSKTNSYEINYSLSIDNGNFSMAFFHRISKNPIVMVYDTIFDINIKTINQLETYINIDAEQNSGAELSFSYNFLDNLKFSFYNVSSINSLKGIYRENVVNEQNFSNSLKTSIQYKLMKTIGIQIQEVYKTQEISFLSKKDAVFYTNLQLNGNFFNNNLIVSTGIRDIFNQNSSNQQFSTGSVYNQFYNKYISRLFNLSLIYKFGNRNIENKMNTQMQMDK